LEDDIAMDTEIENSLNRIALFNETFAEIREFVDSEYSEKTFEKMLALADEGVAVAALALGIAFELGKNAPFDRERARHYYALASNLGISAADFHLGRVFYDDNDYQSAVPCFLRAAEKGDLRTSLCAGTFVYLGTCLEHGFGITKNPDLAFSCYRNAAILGDRSGIYYLAKCYRHGIGVDKHEDKMMMFLREACKMNDARAWYMLGSVYSDGEVDGARNEAILCFEKAAELELPEALEFCGEYFVSLKVDNAEILQKGVRYLHQAIEKERYRACYVLAFLHSQGRGVERNLERAFELCKLAAENGIDNAKLTIESVSANNTTALQFRENWYL
jgi:hypothetical protein